MANIASSRSRGLPPLGLRRRQRLGLYAEHGVEGTSPQKIADALGVTKAAVYYYFKTKDEIAHAVNEPGLRDLRVAVTAAEAQRRRGARVDTMLDGLVDVIISSAPRCSTRDAVPSAGPGADLDRPAASDSALGRRLQLRRTRAVLGELVVLVEQPAHAQ